MNIYDLRSEKCFDYRYLIKKYPHREILDFVIEMLYTEIDLLPLELSSLVWELGSDDIKLRSRVCLFACIYGITFKVEEFGIDLLLDVPINQLMLVSYCGCKMINLIKTNQELVQRLAIVIPDKFDNNLIVFCRSQKYWCHNYYFSL